MEHGKLLQSDILILKYELLIGLLYLFMGGLTIKLLEKKSIKSGKLDLL